MFPVINRMIPSRASIRRSNSCSLSTRGIRPNRIVGLFRSRDKHDLTVFGRCSGNASIAASAVIVGLMRNNSRIAVVVAPCALYRMIDPFNAHDCDNVHNCTLSQQCQRDMLTNASLTRSFVSFARLSFAKLLRDAITRLIARTCDRSSFAISRVKNATRCDTRERLNVLFM